MVSMAQLQKKYWKHLLTFVNVIDFIFWRYRFWRSVVTPSPRPLSARSSVTSRRSSATSHLTSSRRWPPLPPPLPSRSPTSCLMDRSSPSVTRGLGAQSLSSSHRSWVSLHAVLDSQQNNVRNVKWFHKNMKNEISLILMWNFDETRLGIPYETSSDLHLISMHTQNFAFAPRYGVCWYPWDLLQLHHEVWCWHP